MSAFIDITGEKYGMLTILSLDYIGSQGARWICQCDCGSIKSISGKSIRSNKTVSCGCYGKTRVRVGKPTHGHTIKRKISREYNTWSGMICRCNNENHTFYDHYGGRGITICDRWYSFENFLADMGSRPINHSLERIDNDKGYYPDNCRWETQYNQSNNKRNNHTITYNGKTKTISQWATEINMGYQTLYRRLKAGWSIEDAFYKEVKEFDIPAMLLHRKENKLLREVKE